MNPEMAMVMKRNEEREALRSVIQQWNANRLDLFELSEPNENLEFHGVMRFYFQDSGQKVATKCIRVASDATAQDVVETLIEKFRPDMRMLSLPEYALFEIHENGEERKLAMDEKPLLVQLNWHKDDREGRFLLRRLDDKTNVAASTFQQDGSSFRRKLSKREKKQLKKQEKLNRIKSNGANDENDARVAEKLYSELPETSFTRSISNPEAVMRRRRQQILERKLQQFRSKDGGPDTGGTLKIYGESLCRDVPYKTLLLSIRDTAQQVVREMLMKYGLEKEDPHNYCLVQVNGISEYSKENKDYHPNNVTNNNNNNQEYILDDDECPLAILMTHPHSQGSIMFHVRRRPADYHPRKRKKKPQHKWGQHQSGSNELLEYRYEDGLDRLPLFLELNPDGSEICGGAAKRHRLHPNVTEVGCERNTSQTQSQYLQLFGPNILPRHCVIANTEGIVTVTPCSRDSETYVNGQRIYETTILRNGAIVKFGRIHCYRFLDPYFEERIRQRHDSLRNIHEYAYDRQSTKDDTSSQTTLSMDRKSPPRNAGQPQQNSNDPMASHNFETTFDVDGNIETRSTSSQGNNKEDSRSQRSVGSGSKDGNRIPGAASYQRVGTDAILPAVLEIREETEEALLNEIITSLDPNIPSFKLAPAYCLYLMARYRASTHYRPELTPTERAHRLTLMLARVATLIQNVIQEHYCDIKSLALWLANASELLFFLQFDRHLFAFSKDARRILSDSVQISFRHLVGCVQSELSAVMPHFFADKDDTSHESEDSPTVLGVLASAMALLRRYRVNVALTVQLFSHLFHFINVWAFNRLIAPNTNYCSRLWGLRLKSRLAQIEAWAERQGLEISTDTHLARIVQAAHLLQAPKYTGEDLASLSSTCFLLNSLQLRTLLLKYQPAADEPTLPRDLIENVVRVAENLADELARSDGREVKLEEDPEFALEFVLPIDSYSCEVVRGIPPGLIEFVAPLQSMGLCRLSTQPTSNGLWTVYMELPSAKGAMMRSPSAMSNRSVGYLPGPQEPEINVIKLHKSNNGMGLSIVAAKGAGQDKLGIYIKAVVKGGAADADGRLQAGDQLLKVDGQSLVGITQEKAAEYLVRTGPIVTLEVAKQGAIYHGLATLLSQPSPVMTREKPRPRSELFAEPIREVLPSSYSMINLHQNNYATEADGVVHWEDRVTGVTGNDSNGCQSGGGGSVGKHLMKLPRNKNNFQPRYGNFLHPDYALLYPSNVCHEEPYAGEEEEEEEDEDDDMAARAPRGVLTPSDNLNRTAPVMPTCSYPPPMVENKLCLCEDVLQARDGAATKRSSLEWKCRGRASPRRSFSDPKPASLTKRLVSDVASCCLGVVPESDASTCADEEPVRRMKDKSVMTDESSFRRCYSVDAVQEGKIRNSCPLEPLEGELCECEKSIRSGTEPATKVLYENGGGGDQRTDLMTPSGVTVERVTSSACPPTICDIVALNDRYQQSNLKRLLSNFRSLGDMATAKEVDVSRRSSSDASLYQRSSLIAECTKCGNKFDIRDKYFSRAVVENVTTTSTSNTSTSSSHATGTSTSSSDRESAPEQSDKDRKLTKEEREDILRELEDIISGNFFGTIGDTVKRNATTGGFGGARSFPSSMLHLDLNTLKDSDTSASEGSLQVSNFSSITDSNDFRTGRVAELARHFSKLGEAGIIKAPTDTKTKSVPNLSRYVRDSQPKRYQRSSSMEQLNRKEGVVLTELHDDEGPPPSADDMSQQRRTSADEGYSHVEKRRQSFARQNTVFCKMKSVDELDLKRQQKPRKLYKYASLADFRICEAAKTEDKKKVVSFDDLSLRRSRDPVSTPEEPEKSIEKKEFNLESFLLKNKPSEENLKINYDKMTTAIRDYLANKELLLKRMKSNSIEQFGTKSCSLSNLNRACPNFTTIREADDKTTSKHDLKAGMSMDALYMADAGDRAAPEADNEEDDFNFKHNLRRVYKGSYFKGRRFRRCRKLDNRRSFLIYPGENLNRFRLSDEMKRETFDRYRCQSLDTGMEAVPSHDGDFQRSRGRRMSERDLPSRISNEQANQATQLPMHTPLIHSSKSVPSLNSPGVNEGQVVSPVASRSSHEVFNSSYNCTSSTNNISMQHPALRSRSSQNLNDSRSLSNYPQNVTPNLPNRQPSNPNLLQNNVPSPHYQYYNQLPQQQHPMYHQHVQQQQMLMHQQQQQQHYQYTPPNHVEGERFYQNLNVYRNHEMPNGVITNGTGNATMMKGKVLSPQQPDRSSNQFQRSFRGSQTSLQQQPQGRQSVEILPSYMKERPSSAYLQKENYPPPQNMTMSGRSQSTRDIIRQEAKLQEMTEEVRRREIRSNFSPQQHYPISPSRVQSPGEVPEGGNPQYVHHKQGQMMYDGQPARPPYPSHKIGTMRPSIEEMGYRESPPPPPPPPTSTHPLYQSNAQRSHDNSTLTNQAPQQRLDSLLEQSNAPPPPERGSSFAVMSQALRSPVGTPSQTRNDVSQSNSTTPKKVSFQDSTPESNANNTSGEKVVVDLNRFINEAESMLGSPKSPDTQFLDPPLGAIGTQEVYKYVGATPGVIGTQEVYKDPRQRRLAEQQHQKLLSSKVVPVPEKLTFKEKMKMFAMETGEDGTPKDKVKISRAQRDIDNLNSPSAPNANNISKNNGNHENMDNRVK